MTRQVLRALCRALVGVVLFAQLAVAAYACPGLSAASGMTMQQAAPGPMAAHCDDMAGAMDASFAKLCAEHCHQGQQSDHAASLTVPAAVLTALYFTPLAPEPLAAPRPAADASRAWVAAPVPYTILHCCFRI